jgi:hypothetical protein
MLTNGKCYSCRKSVTGNVEGLFFSANACNFFEVGGLLSLIKIEAVISLLLLTFNILINNYLR